MLTPNDCWNRIFYCLFTRTVKIRVTDDFPDAAPFGATTNLMGNLESGHHPRPGAN